MAVANCCGVILRPEQLVDVVEQRLGAGRAERLVPGLLEGRAPSSPCRRRTAGTRASGLPANLLSTPLTTGTLPASVIHAWTSASVSRPSVKYSFAIVFCSSVALARSRSSSTGCPRCCPGRPCRPRRPGSCRTPGPAGDEVGAVVLHAAVGPGAVQHHRRLARVQQGLVGVGVGGDRREALDEPAGLDQLLDLGEASITAGSDQASALPSTIAWNTSGPPIRSSRYSSHIMQVHRDCPPSDNGATPAA